MADFNAFPQYTEIELPTSGWPLHIDVLRMSFLGTWFIHRVSEDSQEGLRGTAYLHKCLSGQIYESYHSTSPKVWLRNFSFPIKQGSDLIPQVGQLGGKRYILHKGLVVCPCSSVTLAWKDLQCRGDTITGQPSVSIQLGAGLQLLKDPHLFSAHPNRSLLTMESQGRQIPVQEGMQHKPAAAKNKT